MSSAPYGFYAGLAMAAGTLLLNSIPWVAVFLLTQYIGLSLHVLKDRDTCTRVQKRISRSSHIADGGKNYGYSVGWGYIASISITNTDNGTTYDCWILCTATAFKALTEDVPVAASSTASTASATMTIYQRLGPFWGPWFKKRTIPVESWAPRAEQVTILDAIQAHQVAKRHTVCYIHGPPGSGKSMIGLMLTERLKGSYCNTLKPWQPGDALGSLHNEVEPTAEAPLIVAFDEVDGVLVRLHTGAILPHKSFPTEIIDKASWNQFLDNIHRGMFPHLIVVMTSNRGPEFVRALCPSYLREGRVDMVFELKKVAQDALSADA